MRVVCSVKLPLDSGGRGPARLLLWVESPVAATEDVALGHTAERCVREGPPQGEACGMAHPCGGSAAVTGAPCGSDIDQESHIVYF